MLKDLRTVCALLRAAVTRSWVVFRHFLGWLVLRRQQLDLLNLLNGRLLTNTQNQRVLARSLPTVTRGHNAITPRPCAVDLVFFLLFSVSGPEKHAEQEFLSMIYLPGLGE